MGKCKGGAGLALAGFSMFFSAIGSVPAPALAVLVGGSLANCYALVAVAHRVFRNLAERHVDQLVVIAHSDREAAEESIALHVEAVTTEERLAATSELNLEVRTGTSQHWIT